jgi:hypothetical protein
MKKILCLLSLGLTCAGGTVAAAGTSLTELLGSSELWRTFDWPNAPDSQIWHNRNWVDYLGSQSDTEHRLKIQEFSLGNIEWQTTLEARQGNKSSPWQLTVYTPATDTLVDHCDSLYTWAVHHFGAPRIAVDGSYSIPGTEGSPEHRYADRHYQWDLGNTRITQECVGQSELKEGDTSRPYAVSALRFAALDTVAEIHPLISAHCTRSLRLNESGDLPLKMSDLTFIIDENNGAIRRPDLVPIRVRTVSIGKDQVRFSIAIDKSTNDYQIDLPSGQLSATMSVSGIRAGRVNGQCSMTPVLTAQTPSP